MEQKIITIEEGKEQYGPVIAMLQWYNDILVGNTYWQNICARHAIASADRDENVFFHWKAQSSGTQTNYIIIKKECTAKIMIEMSTSDL